MRVPNRNLPLRLAVLCAVLPLVPLAQAVNLNPRGLGQVLIYPYYTVNGGQSTLLSLVNTTGHAKALKVHLRESRNGREVLGFNLYLSAFDMWTGVLFALGENESANLLTDDKSCTVPDLQAAPQPTLSDGRHYVPFQNTGYSGNNFDSGPSDLSRTREGEIEVIEMGEVVDGSPSLQALMHVGDLPRDCASIVHAWDSGGYWAANSGTDISTPGGGLYGTLAVVNAAQGTIFEVAATALDGFSEYAQHGAPGAAHPDLGDARTSPRGVDPPYAEADVPVGATVVHARYAGADRTVDAVSAVLAATDLRNEYSANPEDGSNTDWVITFPTKRHYVDKALIGAAPALPPFSMRFDEGKSCATPYFLLGDRNAGGMWVPSLSPFPVLPPPPYSLCGQANVGALYGNPGASSHVLASSSPDDFPPYSRFGQFSSYKPLAGILDVDLQFGAALRPDTEGRVFAGMPALGFMVVTYTNRYVGGSVLANYSAAVPHRTVANCRDANLDPCQ